MLFFCVCALVFSLSSLLQPIDGLFFASCSLFRVGFIFVFCQWKYETGYALRIRNCFLRFDCSENEAGGIWVWYAKKPFIMLSFAKRCDVSSRLYFTLFVRVHLCCFNEAQITTSRKSAVSYKHMALIPIQQWNAFLYYKLCERKTIIVEFNRRLWCHNLLQHIFCLDFRKEMPFRWIKMWLNFRYIFFLNSSLTPAEKWIVFQVKFVILSKSSMCLRFCILKTVWLMFCHTLLQIGTLNLVNFCSLSWFVQIHRKRQKRMDSRFSQWLTKTTEHRNEQNVRSHRLQKET